MFWILARFPSRSGGDLLEYLAIGMIVFIFELNFFYKYALSFINVAVDESVLVSMSLLNKQERTKLFSKWSYNLKFGF